MSAGTPGAAETSAGGTAARSQQPDQGAHRAPTAVAQFARHRNLLFTVAYEITASVADAEGVVQETYLRWAQAAEQPGGIRQPRAYLVQIATRQALNRLRSRARQREEYVGPWLPEPLLTTPDVADDVVLAESVSMAMMLVVETSRRTSGRFSSCARSSISAMTRSRRRWACRRPRSDRSLTGPNPTCNPGAPAYPADGTIPSG